MSIPQVISLITSNKWMNKILHFTFILFLSTAAQAEDKAIIVFDASGSMWGQLEGKTKISIAKKTLNNLVTNWDESKHLGLLAYGHRKKGDCKDIETLVPVAKINKSSMKAIVNKINPKGKTPISASILMAANELRYTEDNATVILISDGKETCNADPCATAAELEKLGVNFTAHVIGFGVDKKTSEQLQCIADNTGGKYFSADNAEELNEALEKVIEKKQVITIRAMDQEKNTILHKMVDWKLINQETEEVISATGTGAAVYFNLQGDETTDEQAKYQKISAGKWLVSGISANYSGEATVEIGGDEDQLIKVDMNKVLPKVTINAVDEAITGTALDISWDAPKDLEGLINLQIKGDKAQFHVRPFSFTKNKNESVMRLPSIAGDYVLRYYDTRDQKTVLAEKSIVLKPAEIVINAPDQAGTGTEIDLSWVSPKTSEAVINLQAADEKINYNVRPYLYTKGKKEATMRMPSVAGDYILRYFNQSDQKLVIERPIKITEEVITITAPNEAGTGTEIDIAWDAPKSAQAVINLQIADERPNYNARPYLYTKGKKEATMRMPSVAGDYILRYFNQSDQKVIREHPITLIEQKVTITAPDEAIAGSLVELNWEAPKGLDSFINIQLADEKPNYNARPYIYTKKKTSGDLRVPSTAGKYVLRWYNRNDTKLISERLILLKASEITITAADEAIAGTELEVSWVAPKGLDSFINIQLATDKASYNAVPYIYTKKKTSDYLRLPSTEGEYVLRWYNRNDKKLISERPILLKASEITITAADEAIAGTELEVSWVAPKGLDSFINIQLATDKASYNAVPYIYTKKKTSDYLRLPSTAGDYVMRWFNRNDKKMLSERPITLSAPEIIISAPDKIQAGEQVEISWQAPKGLNSFINLQSASEKINYNARPYFYTSKKSTGTLLMPTEAGDYILRWYNRNDKKLMSELKITIQAEE